MPFTKLDSGILQSSIMAADPALFKVWIALLASCGPDGVARVAPTYISAVCRMDLEVTRECFKRLTEPDPDSRTPDHEGRRIERVDGGWAILNYKKYREIRDKDDRRRQLREAQARHRANQDVINVSRGKPSVINVSHGHPMSAQAEAEAEADTDVVGGRVVRSSPPTYPPTQRAERAVTENVDSLQLRLGSLLCQLSEHGNSRLMVPAWSEKVTSYESNGKKVRGRQDFRMIRSPERLQRSIEDAEWWLSELEKGRVVDA